MNNIYKPSALPVGLSYLSALNRSTALRNITIEPANGSVSVQIADRRRAVEKMDASFDLILANVLERSANKKAAKSDKPVAVIQKAPAGAGKTHRFAQKIGPFVQQHPGKPIIYAAANYNLLSQTEADLLRYSEESGVALELDHYKGRQQYEDCVYDNETIAKVADAGVPVHNLCVTTNSDGEKVYCERYHACQRIADMLRLNQEAEDAAADVITMPHAMLTGGNKPKQVKNARLVVIDEVPHGSLSGDAAIPLSTLTMARPTPYLTKKQKAAGVDPESLLLAREEVGAMAEDILRQRQDVAISLIAFYGLKDGLKWMSDTKEPVEIADEAEEASIGFLWQGYKAISALVGVENARDGLRIEHLLRRHAGKVVVTGLLKALEKVVAAQQVAHSAISSNAVKIRPNMPQSDLDWIADQARHPFAAEEWRFWLNIRKRLEAIQADLEARAERHLEDDLAGLGVKKWPTASLREHFMGLAVQELASLSLSELPFARIEELVAYADDVNGHAGEDYLEITWVADFAFPNTPLLILDADAQEPLYRAILGRTHEIVMVEITYEEMGSPLNAVLINGLSASNSSLFPSANQPVRRDRRGRIRDPKAEAATTMAQIKQAVSVIAKAHPASPLLVCSTKKVRGALEQWVLGAAGMIGEVDFVDVWRNSHGRLDHMHYCAVRGLNRAKDYSAAVMIGKNEPPQDSIRRKARAFRSFDPVACANKQETKRAQRSSRLPMRDGSAMMLQQWRFVDLLEDAVHQMYCAHEIGQAIHRLRPVQKAEAMQTLYIIGNVVPEGVGLVFDDAIHIRDFNRHTVIHKAAAAGAGVVSTMGMATLGFVRSKLGGENAIRAGRKKLREHGFVPGEAPAGWAYCTARIGGREHDCWVDLDAVSEEQIVDAVRQHFALCQEEVGAVAVVVMGAKPTQELAHGAEERLADLAERIERFVAVAKDAILFADDQDIDALVEQMLAQPVANDDADDDKLDDALIAY